MRIDRLRLIAFGGFTDAALDLSSGDSGMHVVYGPNEAGKSTSLRALDCLLFGFPHQGAHDFLHSLRDLRIGATLRRKDGATLEVVRRRGNQNTLRAGDDDEVVLEPTFRAFLGPLDQTTFRTMFALDHASLLAGGKAIATGSGEVGEILFSAGGGLADLHQVKTELDKSADRYFLPRGSKPKINELLTALETAKRELLARQLPSSKGEQLEQALARALAERTTLLAESDEVRRTRLRWDRLREAAPLAAERRLVLADLATVAARPLLPEDRPAERREALSRLDSAEQARRDAESSLA
ncbi:MAG TPA: AAA family ATPase, partial [Pirellulales bacterium]